MMPRLITFQKKGKKVQGFISIASNQTLPFEIKRVFWTYGTPENISRGHHAHLTTEMILIAVSGEIIVQCETQSGHTETFTLNNPNMGLFIPSMCWHTMKYTTGTVQLVLSNTEYNEADYIRDYHYFTNA